MYIYNEKDYYIRGPTFMFVLGHQNLSSALISQRGNCFFCKFYTVHREREREGNTVYVCVAGTGQKRGWQEDWLVAATKAPHSQSFPQGQSPPHNSYRLVLVCHQVHSLLYMFSCRATSQLKDRVCQRENQHTAE
jgi:hypothetical protein